VNAAGWSTHLMLSTGPGTPDPRSLNSIAAQLRGPA
jgi:hypothetical protein